MLTTPPPSERPDELAGRRSTGSWALRLAVVSWVLGLCCTTGSRSPHDLPPDATEAYRQAYLATRAVVQSIPSFVALAAIGCAVYALKKRTTRSGNDWAGLVLACTYLVLVWGVGTFLTQPRRSQSKAMSPHVALSPEEIEDFAEDVERTLASGDSRFLDSRLDVSAFVHEAFPDEEVDSTARAQAEEGIAELGLLLGRQIVDQIEQGASYTLLRFGTDGEQPTALFRLLGEGGMNYHELFLCRGPDGGVSYDDMLIHVGGIRLSRVLREAHAARHEVFNERMIALTDLMEQGRFDEALDYYRQLPQDIRIRKEFLVMRARAAQEVGEDESRAALEALEAHVLPNDPGLALALSDLFRERGELDRYLRALERLEEAIGGDPLLRAMAAEALLEQGETASAKTEIDRATAAGDDLRLVHEIRLAVALAERDHRTALAELRRLKADFDVDHGDLTQAPAFGHFVTSPEHEEWLEWLCD